MYTHICIYMYVCIERERVIPSEVLRDRGEIRIVPDQAVEGLEVPVGHGL